MADAFIILGALAFVPTGLLMFVRPTGRLFFFVVGLIFFVWVEAFIELGGPDSPMIILPFIGLAISVGSLLAEAGTRITRIIKARRGNDG